MQGQFHGKYLDDLDAEQLTDEEKKSLADLLERDPYAFYNLWRDPDAIQRQIEGDDFKTTPAGQLYQQIGALAMAGAPDNVREYWQQQLETINRPSEDLNWLPPPKTKPNKEKLRQLDDFCANINDELNRVDDYSYHPETDFCPEDNPLNGKWAAIMRIARGEPLIVHNHNGVAKHYRATDPVLAGAGVEIVEITITGYPVELDLDGYKRTDDIFDEVMPDHIHPYTMSVDRKNDQTTILLKFSDIYE